MSITTTPELIYIAFTDFTEYFMKIMFNGIKSLIIKRFVVIKRLSNHAQLPKDVSY